ncbi:arsenical pump membrane protein [Shuttleworthella sp. MSX8B]|uniref:SLC13 family permease n=1 Tax=Shuttleworthella sp. MSX8B TaxID=936574 RepID=UPI00044792F6|nr:SLC13 family permease [Shuttleworthia sp. MSX8B]EUB19028.1 arsenical pump membrane protein [Shuttleworthia sp. MSX8B]
MKILALVLFILMYIVMVARQKYRPHAAMAVAALYLVTGILPLGQVISSINWNVLMMISGTMILVDYFIASGMPLLMADLIMEKSKNVMWIIILMSLFAGLISAFIDNVATVLMVAPVGMAVCRKLKINPVPMIFSIAVSSNLQGAATLVGDTTSILLGSYANMDFLDFFFMQGRPGIFFAVELGALATIPIMRFEFRHLTQETLVTERTQVKSLLPSFLLLAMISLLIGASFIPGKPEISNGIICLGLAGLALLGDRVKTGEREWARRALRSLDTETLFLLLGLFIVIAGVTQVGLIEDLTRLIAEVGGSHLFWLYSLVVWGSVLISAFVDNIPYVATMLPVLTGLATRLGISPYILYFGLLTGATLGGNLTPIGASANITAVGLLKKEGYETGFADFMKVGVPYTLAAVLAGYLYTWFVWAG